MRLHERTGTVDRYEAEGRDPFAKQFIRWDDPAKCCGHSACAAAPRAESMLMGAQRIFVTWPAVTSFPQGLAPVGTRVRTWWDKDVTRGGITGAVIGEVAG